MNTIWGLVMVAIGLFMLVWGTTKSEFVIYRILVERSKSLWGDHVHRFYQVAGIAVIVVGVLFALRVIGR